ncbi:MAG: diacylglycerol kinase family lipid kinase [Alistipes sp.]|nr:diacylglycerol kinase family lipid kinase [Alistipes sp.]
MRALLLYNTSSGRGRIGGHIADIRAIFASAGIDITPRKIDFYGNPFEGAEDVELVVVCGGDGTINFVVNAMKQRGLDPVLGVIPAGTANDFARAIGMKRGILKAAKQIAYGSVREVDCGKANDKYFVNILSFGVLTTTSQHTSNIAKHLIGKLAYLRTGMVDLLDLHHIPLTLRYNGEEMKVDAAMFLAFNGNSAGQFKLAPQSNIEDGKLDILILDYDNRMRTCWNMMNYLINRESGAVRHLQCERIELDCNIDEHTDIDGQPGPRMPLRIECLAGALKIKA